MLTVTSRGQLPGDCNQDASLDLSDAVCLLGHFFSNDPAILPCGDGTVMDPGNLGLLNLNTAPVEVLRTLPNWNKLVLADFDSQFAGYHHQRRDKTGHDAEIDAEIDEMLAKKESDLMEI